MDPMEFKTLDPLIHIVSVKSEKTVKREQTKNALSVNIVSVTRLNDKGGLQRNKELDKLRLVLRIIIQAGLCCVYT